MVSPFKLPASGNCCAGIDLFSLDVDDSLMVGFSDSVFFFEPQEPRLMAMAKAIEAVRYLETFIVMVVPQKLDAKLMLFAVFGM